MGQKIIQQHFSHSDFVQFRKRLVEQLKQLKQVMSTPDFGQLPLKIGAELELYLVDKQGYVANQSEAILTKLNDPLFQFEINQYNLELNLSAVNAISTPFSQLESAMLTKLEQLELVAQKLNVDYAAIGILPTLTAGDIDIANMTDQLRYKLLSQQLSNARGAPFKIDIHGEEDINLALNDVTAEGANTSFQVHMMVPHHEFAQVYNAILLTQPLVTAISANSPFFLTKKGWQETRIALLKQSLDCRFPDMVQHKLPSRVNLACGWLQQDAWQIYAEAVALYPVLLPYLTEPDSATRTLPELAELNLHMGTIWSWNRPVYCPNEQGHIRIELRALPAGPSCIDMTANAAFAIGLAYGLRNQSQQIIAMMPFDFADYNFYRAAHQGLDAQLMWPDWEQYKLVQQPVSQIIRQYLPIALQGLIELGINQGEAEHYLKVIENRLSSGMTGARWQLNCVEHYQHEYQKQYQQHYEPKIAREVACRQMLKDYIRLSKSNQAVSQWERIWQLN